MARIVFAVAVAAVAAALGTAIVLLSGSSAVDAPAAQASDHHSDGSAPAARAAAELLRVTAVTPAVEDLRRVTTQPAHLEAYERTDVCAKASGFLASVLVDIGDRVEQHQVLAELWIPEMQQELSQKSALVRQARAALDQSKARLASAEALVAAAKARLQETDSAVAQHEAEVAYRQREHRRIAELAAARSVEQAIADERLLQLHAAQAALAVARAQVESARAGLHVEQARELQAQADVSYAESQLAVAQADHRQTEILVEYARVRAPYPGLVTRRWVDTGDFVPSAAAGKREPLFTLERVDRLRLVFDVPEAESALVRIGQPVSLVVDALKGRSFPGRTVRLTDVLDPRTRTLRVEAELDAPDADLRAGMYGMITVTLAERPRALLLPTRCVRFEDRTPIVFCVSRGVVRKHPVVLGYSDGTRTEIIEGIAPDDLVVLDSRVPVHPGQAVAVATKTE